MPFALTRVSTSRRMEQEYPTIDASNLPKVDLNRRVAELLHGRTIATAESCTAGRIAEVLACVEHAATFLRGGVVAYQEVVKRRVLGVTVASVMSNECACEMAIGVARLLDTGVAVASTGVAGDEAVDGTPPGTVYVATAIGDSVSAREYRFAGTPEQVCDLAQATSAARPHRCDERRPTAIAHGRSRLAVRYSGHFTTTDPSHRENRERTRP